MSEKTPPVVRVKCNCPDCDCPHIIGELNAMCVLCRQGDHQHKKPPKPPSNIDYWKLTEKELRLRVNRCINLSNDANGWFGTIGYDLRATLYLTLLEMKRKKTRRQLGK